MLAPARTVVAYRKVTEAEEREEAERRKTAPPAGPPPAVAAIKAAGESQSSW